MTLLREYLLVILILQLHVISGELFDIANEISKPIEKVYNDAKDTVVKVLEEGSNQLDKLASTLKGSTGKHISSTGEQSIPNQSNSVPEQSNPVPEKSTPDPEQSKFFLRDKEIVFDAVDQALKNFKQYPFTSSEVHTNWTLGGVKKFSIMIVKQGSASVYALHEDGSGEKAYWLPQGAALDIPRVPNPSDPHYVFAPDFNGGTWTVSAGDKDMFRLKLTNLTTESGTGSFKLGEGFAYMQYNYKGGWSLRLQDRNCKQTMPTFKHGSLESLMKCNIKTLNTRVYTIDYINGADVKTTSLTLFIMLGTIRYIYNIIYLM